MRPSTTIDFWWVSAKAGLLSRTSTPAAVSVCRASSFSDSPLRRAGFSMTRTLTPRCCAVHTAASKVGSVNRNMRMFSELRAASMASTMGLPVSSGRTMSWCDMRARRW